MLSPARRRQCVDHLQAELGISERRACAVAGQHRSTQRKRPRGRDDEEALTAAIIRLASQYGRYGYRRITALLRTEGWHVNAKRVQRIWRREGLKVPQKQPKRGRLWLNDGSCIRLRPCWPNHVWSYDFVMDRTHDGRKFRMLTVIDEFTRRCMAVVVERRLNSDNVLHCLTELFVQHGPPDHIRSDNGSEFTAHAVRDWLGRIGVKTLYIEPGSPWENGYNESFNSKLRDEILNTEIFYTLKEAKVLIERWRHHYNNIRPHSSLGYRPPAPETILPNVDGPTYAVDGATVGHRCRPDDARGLEVSPGGLGQDQLIQSQIRNGSSEPFVLLLKTFEFLELSRPHPRRTAYANGKKFALLCCELPGSHRSVTSLARLEPQPVAAS